MRLRFGGIFHYCFARNLLLKAKFHYASWLEAGRRQVRSWSPTSFEPVCDQLRTSFEPDSVMEFGFKSANERILKIDQQLAKLAAKI